MSEREIEVENGAITIDRETAEPEWMRCTESQWEKKVQLAMKNGNMGNAMKFADYANCISLYNAGHTVKEIQGRFNHG